MTQDDVDQFSASVRGMLLSFAQKLPEDRNISPNLLKEIQARVPPSLVGQYSNLVSVIEIFVEDVASVGLRILRYKQISKYRNLALNADIEIRSAFCAHIYDLRSNEIYTILERAVKTLAFGAFLVKEMGGIGESQVKKFGNLFKKKLERRLRERHRIVHAHERRSVATRILELPEPKTDIERDQMLDVLTDSIVDIITMVAEYKGYSNEEARKLLGIDYFEEIYDDFFLQETLFMWKTFTDHIKMTIK